MGNYELDTWLSWSEVAVLDKNLDAALQILTQGHEFYPENADISYRKAGVYLLNGDKINGRIMLMKALKEDLEKLTDFNKAYPQFCNESWVLELVSASKKTSR